MFPPVDPATLYYALAGAIAGVAIGLVHYIWRDWDYVRHRWQHRPDLIAAPWAGDDSTYRANPVTDKERRQLPLTLATTGAVGAAMVSGQGEQVHWLHLALAAVVALVAVAKALFADGAETLDTTVAARPALTMRMRLRAIANELGGLAIIGFSQAPLFDTVPALAWLKPYLVLVSGIFMLALIGVRIGSEAMGSPDDGPPARDPPADRAAAASVPREAVLGLVSALAALELILGAFVLIR